MIDVQAVAEVAGEHQAGAGEQCVADGVGALEVEQFHGGAGQHQQEREPGRETGGQGEGGARADHQRGPVDHHQ
ncbi:hypothetical protein ACIRU5_24070 [Streptomyces misionensis]|uniref:hypothetical protein n=1 Tax=Streptomyces misionensis TaxID=67331 RepID=UPI003807F38E